MTEPERPAGDRRTRRREQTRSQLLAAAQTLFARQGVEATRINEITDEADVGFGSFYNHFDSKEAIVEAVLEDVIREHGAALEELSEGLDDPAEVVAIAHRHFVRMASSDPEWAWLLVRMDASHSIVLSALGPFAMRDMKRGIAAGRFAVADPVIALRAAGGALMAVMRAVLEGAAPRGADIHHAEGVLRSFGVTPDDAAEVARRRLPRSAR